MGPLTKLQLNSLYGKIPTAPRPLIYLGGPVDLSRNGREWRRVLAQTLSEVGAKVWDPIAENEGRPDHEIMRVNFTQLLRSDFAFFNFAGCDPGQYGFGSPVEIWYVRDHGSRVIVGLEDPTQIGVFLRELHAYYGIQILECSEALGALIAAIKHGI